MRTDASTPAIAPDTTTVYYVHGLRPELLGLLGDLEIRCGRLEGGPSHPIGRIAASRVPVSVRLLQLFLSPDGQWLADRWSTAQRATCGRSQPPAVR